MALLPVALPTEAMYFTIEADVVDIALSATGIVTVTLDTPLMTCCYPR